MKLEANTPNKGLTWLIITIIFLFFNFITGSNDYSSAWAALIISQIWVSRS